jgi:c-di-GMP-binding flagellar brake protein YcgR
MEEHAEIISGSKVIGYLDSLIKTRRVCKMEIPNTEYGWITLLLGIRQLNHSHYLLIDKVAGFEKAFSRSTDQEIFLEVLENDGVPCQFKTRVIECHPTAILAEVPKSIYRMQRRGHFRIKAHSGTEIAYHLNQTVRGMGIVMDYSLGGVAFFMERSLQLHVGQEIDKIELRIPQGDQWISFQIPKVIVRRIERNFPEKDLCCLEFLEMSEKTIEPLWHHIFNEQRMLLRRIKKA